MGQVPEGIRTSRHFAKEVLFTFVGEQSDSRWCVRNTTATCNDTTSVLLVVPRVLLRAGYTNFLVVKYFNGTLSFRSISRFSSDRVSVLLRASRYSRKRVSRQGYNFFRWVKHSFRNTYLWSQSSGLRRSSKCKYHFCVSEEYRNPYARWKFRREVAYLHILAERYKLRANKPRVSAASCFPVISRANANKRQPGDRQKINAGSRQEDCRRSSSESWAVDHTQRKRKEKERKRMRLVQFARRTDKAQRQRDRRTSLTYARAHKHNVEEHE